VQKDIATIFLSALEKNAHYSERRGGKGESRRSKRGNPGGSTPAPAYKPSQNDVTSIFVKEPGVNSKEKRQSRQG